MNSSIIIAAIVVSALTLLTGLILFIRGLRGRWLDSHPYCRKCRYNLTGQTSAKCPECGLELSSDTVAFRIRKRRRISLTFGVIILSIIFLTIAPLGVGSVRAKISQTNWYNYYPSSVLTYLAERYDLKAFNELFRRLDNNLISAPEAARLLERAVLTHEKICQTNPYDHFLTRLGTGTPVYEKWAELIIELDAICPLSPSQRDRFYTNVAGEVNIDVRSKTVAGKPTTFSVHWQMKGYEWLVCHQTSWLILDGTVRVLQASDYNPTTLGGKSTGRVVLQPPLPPGRHRIEVCARQSFRIHPDAQEADAAFLSLTHENPKHNPLQIADLVDKAVPPLWSRIISRPMEIEVLPNDAKGTVQIVRDDEYTRQFKDGLSVEIEASEMSNLNGSAWSKYEPYVLVSVRMHFKPKLDRCLAFEVTAFASDQAIPLDTMNIAPNLDGMGYTLQSQALSPVPAMFDKLIIRSSVEAAELTTDCFEIPDIELEYGPIEIKRVNDP